MIMDTKELIAALDRNTKALEASTEFAKKAERDALRGVGVPGCVSCGLRLTGGVCTNGDCACCVAPRASGSLPRLLHHPSKGGPNTRHQYEPAEAPGYPPDPWTGKVHTAAELHIGTLENTSAEVMRRLFEVNTLGPFMGIRAVLAAMVAIASRRRIEILRGDLCIHRIAHRVCSSET